MLSPGPFGPQLREFHVRPRSWISTHLHLDHYRREHLPGIRVPERRVGVNGEQFATAGERRNWNDLAQRKLIPSPSIEHPAGGVFADATPLLEKERHTLLSAMIANGAYPFGRHGAGAVTALTAHNHPIQPRELHGPEVFEQWLDRKELHRRARFPEVVHARKAEAPVLDADSPPDVRQPGGKPEPPKEQVPQTLGAFCEDLIGVPRTSCHDLRHLFDVIVGNADMEQVAHRVYEDALGLGEPERFAELFGNQSEVESLFKGTPRNAPEPFRKSLGVAVGAAGADFGAAPHRVPSCVRPLNL